VSSPKDPTDQKNSGASEVSNQGSHPGIKLSRQESQRPPQPNPNYKVVLFVVACFVVLVILGFGLKAIMATEAGQSSWTIYCEIIIVLGAVVTVFLHEILGVLYRLLKISQWSANVASEPNLTDFEENGPKLLDQAGKLSIPFLLFIISAALWFKVFNPLPQRPPKDQTLPQVLTVRDPASRESLARMVNR
jgi:hypothetical protein